MPVIFVLLGAVLGGILGGPLAALVGAVLGPIAWKAIQKADSPKISDSAGLPVPAHSPEPAPVRAAASAPPSAPAAEPTLAARVGALEREVAALRTELRRLQPTQAAAVPSVAAPQPPAAQPATLPRPPAIDVPVPATSTVPVPVPVPVPATAQAPAAPDAPAWTAPPKRALPKLPPPPPPKTLQERLPPFVSRFLFGGNTIVKVGVLILFLGLAFLLRYTAERVTVPVEFRYAGVSTMGLVLLVLGWRLRDRADAAGGTGYGVILQGAGIGVFYLTALAAMKLHPLITPTAGFGFMALVAALGAVLAVRQNAPWLALAAVVEGFAAPVLVSTGAGNHVALFTYMLILDAGIFAMAWHKAWRPLNLVGAVATFALASAWANAHYVPAHYASVQGFLLLFFGLFTGISVLFARRALALGDPPAAATPLAEQALHALHLVGRVDSTLTFGVPLAAFSLQYLLTRDMPWGPAWSAFGFAAFYLLLGAALLRGGLRRYALLGEAYVIVSAIFGTLTVPLALEGHWTGATWAVEAAGMYWLGRRQERTYARLFAMLVMAGALVRLATDTVIDLTPGTPLLIGSALGMALLAVSALSIWHSFRRLPGVQRHVLEAANGSLAVALVSLGLLAIPWLLLAPRWAGVASAGLGLAGVLLQRRVKEAALPLCAGAAYVAAVLSLALGVHTVAGSAMLASGWQGLVPAVLIGLSLLVAAGIGLRATVAAAEAADVPPQWSLASSVGLLAGLGVVSGSLLFVLPAEQAAWVWPWVGLGALWLGLQLAHPALGLAWFGLELAAGVATFAWGPPLWDDAPLASGTALNMLPLWAPLMLSVAGLASGDLLQRAVKRVGWPLPWLRGGAEQWAVVAWSLAWWAQLLPPEFHRQLAARHELALWPAVLALLVTGSSLLMVLLARWRDWTVLGQAMLATLPLWAVAAALGPLDSGLRPSAHLGWLAWPLALAWHLGLLRAQEAWLAPPRLRWPHAAGFWFFLLLAAREGQLALANLGPEGSAWATLGFMAVPALALVLVSRPAVLARWPLTEQRDTYLLWAAGPVALYLLAWLCAGNLQAGDGTGLPYLPLLNPLEIGQGLVLLALALWARALPADARTALPPRLQWAGLGAIAFALYTGMVLRGCHHFAGVPWTTAALFDSTLAQAALSVAWSGVGVGLMLAGHRGGRRILWLVGAALLGVVVAKLFLVELADRGSLYRIVSFIVVGVLLLVVGYFAPIPPRRVGEEAPDTVAGAA